VIGPNIKGSSDPFLLAARAAFSAEVEMDRKRYSAGLDTRGVPLGWYSRRLGAAWVWRTRYNVPGTFAGRAPFNFQASENQVRFDGRWRNRVGISRQNWSAKFGIRLLRFWAPKSVSALRSLRPILALHPDLARIRQRIETVTFWAQLSLLDRPRANSLQSTNSRG